MTSESTTKRTILHKISTIHSSENKSLSLFIYLFFITTLGVGLFSFHTYISQVFLPNTSIDGTDVSYLNKQQAIQKIEDGSPQTENVLVKLSVDDISVSTTSAQLGIKKDVDATVSTIFSQTHSKNVLINIKNYLQALTFQNEAVSPLVYNKDAMDLFVTNLSTTVDIIGVHPSATLGIARVARTLEINPGQIGREISAEQTKKKIIEDFEKGEFNTSAIVASTAAELTPDEIVESREYASTFIGYDFEFTGPDHIKKTLTDQDIISVLTLPSGFNQDAVEQLVAEWEEETNREPINAEFQYDEETSTVISFIPDRPGLSIKSNELAETILSTIAEVISYEKEQQTRVTNDEPKTEFEKNTKPIPVITTLPDITLADTNDLGINERIGYGDSEYDHSIPNRIHNVAHTAEKITNTLIAPGEEFSFNKTLGDVSRATGFKSAYVIKGGKTILGDGGGVCQVSTTLFRSLLDSGLEITRRIPHSYRVSYYELDEKPGIDATVYSGNVDLRFRNDTDHHVLIHTEADSENLTMFVELYGTSDGRTTEITEHTTYGYRPPLPPEYADDPSLPPGALKQVDWAAAGISAKFTHIIKDKDGNVLNEEEYVSNYRPWAAKFLRGV